MTDPGGDPDPCPGCSQPPIEVLFDSAECDTEDCPVIRYDAFRSEPQGAAKVGDRA